MAKKNVLVVGDILKDLIVVRKGKSEQNRGSMFALFRQEKLEKHVTFSGTNMLIKIFEELRDSIEPVELARKLNDEAFSELLYEKKVDGLFLKEYFGVFEKSNHAKDDISLNDQDHKHIRESDIVAIYNMNKDFEYCTQENLNEIADTTLILLRTKFAERKTATEFFKLLYKPDNACVFSSR